MFTFKTNKPTGRYRSFEVDEIEIKIKRKVVGYIRVLSQHSMAGPFQIRLAIKKEKTKENPAPFKYITLNRKFATVPELKEFLNTNEGVIRVQFDLYSFE